MRILSDHKDLLPTQHENNQTHKQKKKKKNLPHTRSLEELKP